MEHGANYLKGVRDGIPIALAYFAVSFTLGIACRNVGMTAFQAAFMSFTNMTSAGEFGALSIMAAGAPFASMALSQLVINLRYMLMSCSLSQKLGEDLPLFHRLLVGGCVTDEIFGISVNFPGRLDPFYSYGAMSVACPGWTIGTLLGVVMGNVLPGRVVTALSVALFGMFLGIIVPPIKKDRVLALLIPASMALSWVFARLPLFAGISGTMKIIILTVLLSGAAAVLFPVAPEGLAAAAGKKEKEGAAASGKEPEGKRQDRAGQDSLARCQEGERNDA